MWFPSSSTVGFSNLSFAAFSYGDISLKRFLGTANGTKFDFGALLETAAYTGAAICSYGIDSAYS